MSQRFTTRITILASVFAAGAVLAAGQAAQTPRPVTQAAPPLSAESRWQRAVDAWEAGRYPAALTDLQALMKSSASAEYFERVALLTGELYTATTLTTDGRNPKISGDGGFATFETGTGEAAVTKLVKL